MLHGANEAARARFARGSSGVAPKHFTTPEKVLYEQLWPQAPRSTRGIDFSALAIAWLGHVDAAKAIWPRNAVILKKHYDANKRLQNIQKTLDAANITARDKSLLRQLRRASDSASQLPEAVASKEEFVAGFMARARALTGKRRSLLRSAAAAVAASAAAEVAAAEVAAAATSAHQRSRFAVYPYM